MESTTLPGVRTPSQTSERETLVIDRDVRERDLDVLFQDGKRALRDGPETDEEDFVFEIGLTPNRADAASHIGVARDLAAVMTLRNAEAGDKTGISLQLPDVSRFTTDNNNRVTSIKIIDENACPRYTGITITGIEVKESPEWLKHRLNAIGLRPINNIVDITNFVLHEVGQPLHAFDADAITGGQVIVQKLEKGTKFITLDEVERELSGQDLMICNTAGPDVHCRGFWRTSFRCDRKNKEHFP